jgi:B12-binding domain/radical SAM domain protein
VKGTAIRIVFVEEKTNKNSLAVLAGSIESSPWAAGIDLHFLPRAHLRAGWPPPLAASPPDVLAFSFHTTDLCQIAETLEALRSSIPGPPPLLLAGGAHASGDPEGTLGLGFDALLVGEAEESLPRLLRGLQKGEDLGSVPGLVRKKDGAILRNPPAPPVDLNAHPPFAPVFRRFAPIEISRGCPLGCAYCQTPRLFGPRMRHRTLQEVLRFAEIARAHGLRDLRFVSPNAFAYGAEDGRTPKPARIEKLLAACGQIFGNRHVWFGSFPSEVRPETVTKDTVDLVRAHAANDNLVLGAQSGSDRVLEKIHRGHTVAEVVRAVETVLRGGLRPIVDFIFGFPFETEADREATRALMTRLASLGAQVHSHAFMPLPQTAFWGLMPRPVDPSTRRLLGQLGQEGKMIGSWIKQESLARRTIRFLQGHPG